MARASCPGAFSPEGAEASAAGSDFSATSAAAAPGAAEPLKVTAVSGEVTRHAVSRGSDEVRILREREAWLRSLDRKYGIVR